MRKQRSNIFKVKIDANPQNVLFTYKMTTYAIE